MNAPKLAIRTGLAALLAAALLAATLSATGCKKDAPGPQEPAKAAPAEAAPAPGEEPTEAAPAPAPAPAPTKEPAEAPRPAAPGAAPAEAAKLTGGADIPDAPEPVEVLLWHAYRGTEREALDKLIGAFNDAHDNLKIRALPIPFDALVDKLQVTIPRGQGPDIFIFAHNMIGQWLEAEAKPLIEPIGAWVKPALLQKYTPAAVKPLVYRKSLYGLPLAYKSVLLYYNKKLVEKPPTTTDELLAIAKKHTNLEAKTYGLVYEAASLYFHAPWIYGFGGQILDEENHPHLDSPEQMAAAAFVRDLALQEKVVPENMTTFIVASLFNDGNAAMVVSGPWFRGDLQEGLDYGVALMPTVSATGKPAMPMLGIESVFLNAYSEKKKWAFEVMRYLASDESAIVRARVGGQPVPNTAAYEDPVVKADPYLPVFAEQAKQAVPMHASRQMQVVWGTMDNALKQAIFNPDGSVEGALKAAQEKVVHDIARQRE